MPLYQIDNKMVLHIHVPKCGGTSLERFLADYYFGLWSDDFSLSSKQDRHTCQKVSPQHMHAVVLAEYLNLKKIALAFAVVRDPVSRLISEFLWAHRDEKALSSPDLWVLTQLKRSIQEPSVLDNHIRAMHEFILPGTVVFRLEDGLEHLRNFLAGFFPGVSFPDLMPAINRRKNREPVLLSASTRQLIRDFYADDYDLFYGDKPDYDLMYSPSVPPEAYAFNWK